MDTDERFNNVNRNQISGMEESSSNKIIDLNIGGDQYDSMREKLTSLPFGEDIEIVKKELLDKIIPDQLLVLHNQFFYISDLTSYTNVFVHPHLTRVLGYKPDFFLDYRNVYNCIHPQDVDFVMAFSQKSILYPRSWPKEVQLELRNNPYLMVFSLDFRIKRIDGTYIRVNRLTSCLKTDSDGRMIYTLSFYTDISHIKKNGNITWDWKGDPIGKFNVDDLCRKYLPQCFSSREREIIKLFSEGMSGNEIAGKLSISESTVITHRKHMLRKAKVKNTAELIKYAVDNGIL